ncbi:serine/threonine-protein kinase [Streptacidiphilus sp. MAP12-16]|uniref:serine/threonine-protein kinase n=1 Tax=Streptacidiphilus sp. MAP12-16 TaxID=3156300 RepID=UPI0035125DCA
MNTGGPAIRLIDDRFELLQQLGGGGMGLVWRARDIALQREVALKEVRPLDPAMAAADPAGAREMRERVLREARSLARLQHPNVVTIHHIVDTDEHPHPWLVMELVSGGSLADRLARDPLSVPEAARIGRGVLSALRAAHAAGIQHRDVKPGNVLLRTDGTPVLTDFGIAAMHGATALTATGSLIGSPEYIAPERIRGEEGNPASDLWSLGMMLYVAVEGYHPLRRATTLATLAAVLDEPLPPPQRAGQLGPALSALLARNPAARPDADRLDRLLAAAEYGGGAAPTDAPPTREPTFLDTPKPATPAATPAAPSAPADRRPDQLSLVKHPAQPSPPPQPPPHRRRAAVLTLSIAAVALTGTLAWNLRPGHSTATGAAGSTSSPVQGVTTSGGPQTTPVPAPTAQPDLLTPAGLRATIKAMRPLMAGTKVEELDVYPGYASADVPTQADPALYDRIDYRDGSATRSPGGTVISDSKPVDLQGFDWNVLPALLMKAQATLNVPHPTSRYIIVGPDMFDGTPTIRVYLADDYGSGYLSADTKGVVKKTYPRGS